MENKDKNFRLRRFNLTMTEAAFDAFKNYQRHLVARTGRHHTLGETLSAMLVSHPSYRFAGGRASE